MSEFHALDITVCLFLSFFLKKNIYIVIAFSRAGGRREPSVGERSGLGGVCFLSPLHQQRVRGIFDFLDLDLFVVHSHGGQRARHLLLRAGGTGSTVSTARSPPGPPGQLPPSDPQWEQIAAGAEGPTTNFSSPFPSADLPRSQHARTEPELARFGMRRQKRTVPRWHPGRRVFQTAMERGFTFTSSHRSFSSFSTRLVCSGVWGTCMDCCRESRRGASAESCRHPIPSPSLPHPHPCPIPLLHQP